MRYTYILFIALVLGTSACSIDVGRDDRGSDNPGTDSGSSSGPAVLEQFTLPASVSANDRVGNSVAIAGNYAIVGAPQNDDEGDNAGAAFVFTRSNGSWVRQAVLYAPNAAANDHFGISVAINGEYAVIGASLADSGAAGSEETDAGAVYIFKRSGDSWTEDATLNAGDPLAEAHFGHSVAIDGDYVLVGSPRYEDVDSGYDIDSGTAYIFKRSDGSGSNSWTEQAELHAIDTSNRQDEFGISVAIDGDYAIIGSHQDGDELPGAGSAYIFKRSGNSWTQQRKLYASAPDFSGAFGLSVAIDGEYALVGAHRDEAGEVGAMADFGAAYVFKRTAELWSQSAKLVAPDRAYGDAFGYSVAMDGEYAIISAYLADNEEAGTDSGTAYIFKRGDNDRWDQGKRVISSAVTNDTFGYSLAISGEYVIIGSPNDDIGDPIMENAGSAHIYKIFEPSP